MQNESGYDQASNAWNKEETPGVSLWQRAEKGQMSPVNGEAEADDCKAGEDPDEDGKDEEENFFVESAFEGGEQTAWNAEAYHRGMRNRLR
jgi:hypothetical protein